LGIGSSKTSSNFGTIILEFAENPQCIGLSKTDRTRVAVAIKLIDY